MTTPPGRSQGGWATEPAGQQGYGQQPPHGQPTYGQQPDYGLQPDYGQPPPYGQPPGQPRPDRPGVVPLRPLGLGEILDATFTTIRRYPKPTLVLAGIVAILSGLLSIPQNASMFAFDEEAFDGGFNAEFGTSIGTSAAGGTITWVLTALLAGALMLVLAQAVLGRPVELSQVWERLRPRIWSLLGVSLLTVAIMIGLAILGIAVAVLLGVVVHPALGVLIGLALLPFVLYIYGLFLLASPPVVLEGAGPVTALKRSITLVRGSWWRVVGRYVLMSIIVSVISGILLLPASIIAGVSAFESGGTGVFGLFVLAIATALTTVVTTPLTAYLVALLYVDQRMRKEGLDIQLASLSRGVAGGGQPAPGGRYGGQPGGQYGGQYGGQPAGQYGGQPGAQQGGHYGGYYGGR